MRATASARLDEAVLVSICLTCHLTVASARTSRFAIWLLDQALTYQAEDLELACSESRVWFWHWLGCGAERQFLKLDRSEFEVEGRGLKCFLGELGIGDVVGDPHYTDRLTRGIHHAFGSVDQRPHPAISADDPVLERERRALGDRPLDSFSDALSIVGVNASLAAFEGGIELIWGEPVDVEQTVGPPDPVAQHVPLPAPGLSNALSLRQPLLTAAEFALYGHTVGDVADDGAASRLAASFVEDPGAYLHLNWHAVAPDHPGHAADTPGAFALFQHWRPPLIGEVGHPLTTERADLGLTPSQDLTGRGVRGQHSAVGHGEQHAIRAVLVHRPIGLRPKHLRRPIALTRTGQRWLPHEPRLPFFRIVHPILSQGCPP